MKAKLNEYATNRSFYRNRFFLLHFLLMSLESINDCLIKNDNSIINLVTYANYFMYNKEKGEGEMTEWRKLYVQVRMWCNQTILS